MPVGVLAKLSRPKLYGAVPRARLFQRLDEMREHPAIWVCGPPGAGKTTLVASYVSERAIPGMWYQVDAGDADPATFFYYLGIALEQAIKSKHRALPLLTPELQGDLDRFSRRYFRELFGLLPERALLVLDNVQEAVDSALYSVFESLIEEIPENLNVVCMSRTDPPSALARYTSTGRLVMLEWTDLRLTLEETRQIAAVKQPIAEPTLLRLLEQSEGWAAGVTLMLERIARTGEVPETIEAETREAVFNYFAGTLFDKQAADTRQVLLRTAFLPQITPSAAETLTGNPNAGKLLEYLHRRHLFTYRHRLGVAKSTSKKRSSELDEATYEYHALFRDFLLAKAQEEYTRTGLRRLLEETARLLESIELEEEAIGLYRRAEDWDSLTGILTQAGTALAAARPRADLARVDNSRAGARIGCPALGLLLVRRIVDTGRPPQGDRMPGACVRALQARTRHDRSDRVRRKDHRVDLSRLHQLRSGRALDRSARRTAGRRSCDHGSGHRAEGALQPAAGDLRLPSTSSPLRDQRRADFAPARCRNGARSGGHRG
jgi:ATP/maltotriose-dependent transcriptional regulator MalT